MTPRFRASSSPTLHREQIVLISNLLLARSVARRTEFGIRLAIGASSIRLSRQLLTETLLLAGIGAIAGLALTPWTAEMLPAMVPDINAPVILGFNLNSRMLAFTTATCLSAGFLAGLIPALFWFRSDVNESLREGGRGGSQSARSNRTRSLLVISEVALACMALVSAGVFVRTFDKSRNIDPGFDKDNVMLARFYLAGFSTQDLRQFCVRLCDRVRSMPGVEDVSYADYAPLGAGSGPYAQVIVEGYTPARGESMNINRYLIAPGYFHTLRVPLRDGRDFRQSDDDTAPLVIIVNETFVNRYFQGSSALGRKVRLGRSVATVVGMSKDHKYFDVTESPRPHFYAPFQQRVRGSQQLFLFAKIADRPQAFGQALRSEVAAIEPRAGALDVMRLSEWTAVTLLPQRVTASLAGALGLISLTLAAIGLYSVMAWSVTQRTHEIGIRVALGAPPRLLLADIMRRGFALTIAGLIAGMAAAFAALRFVAAILVSAGTTDPAPYAGAALFVIAVCLLASYVPARRATKVDPITALRCE